MNPKSILLVIQSDPEISKRPAEAVRMAAGLVSWKKLSITLCFKEKSLKALDEYADELENGDIFLQYLPMFNLEDPYAQGIIIVGDRQPENPNPEITYKNISVQEFGALSEKYDCLMTF